MDFEADDGVLTDLVFCLLGCHEAKNEPVKIISRVSKLAADVNVRENLRQATSSDEIYGILTGDRLLQAA